MYDLLKCQSVLNIIALINQNNLPVNLEKSSLPYL